MKLRKAFVLQGNPVAPTWVKTPFKEIANGDIFYVEDDGVRQVDANGHNTWVATTDVYVDPSTGADTIKCDPLLKPNPLLLALQGR